MVGLKDRNKYVRSEGKKEGELLGRGRGRDPRERERSKGEGRRKRGREGGGRKRV